MQRWRGEQFHYCHGGWLAILSGERLKEKREQENIKSMARSNKTFMRSYLCPQIQKMRENVVHTVNLESKFRKVRVHLSVRTDHQVHH